MPHGKSDSKADDVINDANRLKTDRQPFEAIWRKVADNVFPRMNVFDNPTGDSNQNVKRKTVVYSLPQFALTRFASSYDDMITPSSDKWHELSLTDKSLENESGVGDWLVQARDALFRERYSGTSNFSSQNFEKYISLGLFGTGVLAIDANPAGGIIYKSHHIAEHFMQENEGGRIDIDYHRFHLKGHQAIGRYGEELSDVTFNKADANPFDLFEFIHYVAPNPDFDPDSLLSEKKKFISLHIDVSANKVIRTSGFNTFPYAVSRYITIPNDIYGTSPTMLVLPDILMANEMIRTGLVSKKLRGLPPVLAKNDGIVTPAGGGKISAGKFVKGGLDSSGNPNLRPYISGADPVAIDNEVERSDNIINDAYLINLFNVLTETGKRMTAVEVLERVQEKASILAPLMGREQAESLAPQVEREMDILSSQGKLPELPEALLERDADYSVVFTSPLAKAQRAREALGVMRTYEAASIFAGADPTVLDNLDLDKALKIINDSNIGNTQIMRTDEEVAELRAQREAQQQAMAALQMVAGAEDLEQE